MWRRGKHVLMIFNSQCILSPAALWFYCRGNKFNARPTQITQTATAFSQPRDHTKKTNDIKVAGRFFNLCTSRLKTWIITNAMPLATYQLFIEAICTGVCAWLFFSERLTTADVKTFLHSWRYPFIDFVDWDSGNHVADIKLANHNISAATLTAIHTGHNVANCLLPLQVVFLALTYPAVVRVRAASEKIMATRNKRLRELMLGCFFAKNDTVKNTTSCHPFGKPKRSRR